MASVHQMIEGMQICMQLHARDSTRSLQYAEGNYAQKTKLLHGFSWCIYGRLLFS